MNKMKHAVILCGIMILFVIASVDVHAQENNPFSLDVSQVQTGSDEITIYVTQNASAGLSAMQFTVGYDAAVLEPVPAENDGYCFTEEYKSSYMGGLLSCNKKSDGLLIFAGVKMDAAVYNGRVAMLKFRILSGDAVRTELELTTDTAAVETEQGIEKLDIAQPKVTVSIALKKLSGDVDSDGQVTLADAQKTLKAALKLIKFEEGQIALGDMNGNSAIDLEDAQIILKKALKLIPL